MQIKNGINTKMFQCFIQIYFNGGIKKKRGGGGGGGGGGVNVPMTSYRQLMSLQIHLWLINDGNYQVFLVYCHLFLHREKKTDRQTDRQTHTDRYRQTARQTDRHPSSPHKK